MRLLYDLECDALLDEVTVVHCIALIDVDNDSEVRAYHDDLTVVPRHGSIQDGLDILESADTLIGHNIIGYDNAVLDKLHGVKIPVEKSWDTLVASRLAYSDRKELDFRLHEAGKIPGNIIGQHSLKAWGIRLGENKMDYDGGFKAFHQTMLDYCLQDVRTNLEVYRHLTAEVTDELLLIEQQYVVLLEQARATGVQLDIDKAERLVMELEGRMADLETQIQEAFPPIFVPHKPLANGNPRMVKCKYRGGKFPDKMIPFDPGSRLQLARRLADRYDWTPTQLTHKGNPQLTEDVLTELAKIYPEVAAVAEYHIIKARLGTIRDGNHSYFKLVDYKGRLHGRIHHIGTVTHRASSSAPNMQNVCSVTKPYGKEIRTLFVPHAGYVQMGFDADGLELRMLAHYLGRWDHGAYAQAVVSGDKDAGTDAHSLHAAAISSAVPCDRTQAKTVTYGFLYGAGDGKLGSMFGQDGKLGSRIRSAMRQKIKGLGPLTNQLADVVKTKGSITSLDGRRVGIRSEHAALNSLLQSAGATVMRYVLLFFKEELEARGVVWGRDYLLTGAIHDEYQGSLKPGLEAKADEAVEAAFARTTSYLNLRCPVSGTAAYGQNWLDTH